MKLIETLTEQLAEMGDIIRRTLIFEMSNNDNCAVQVTPSLLNAVNRDRITLDLHVELFLGGDVIRPSVFHEIMMGTIEILVRRGIENLNGDPVFIRFKNINIYKDKMKVDLFKFIKPQTRDLLKRGDFMTRYQDGHTEFNFITKDDLPTLDTDYSTDQVIQTERAKNIFKAFRRGKMNGVSYSIDDYIKLSVEPDYDKVNYEKNIIKPHFKIVIYSHDPEIKNNDFITIDDDTLVDVMKQKLWKKFHDMGIIIKF